MTDFHNNAESNATPKLFRQLHGWFTDTAVIVLSTLILLIGFSFLSWAFFAIRGPGSGPDYYRNFRPRAIHRMDTDQAIRFFKEFDRMGENETYIYQPWVAFSERVFHSPRLNVDEAMPMPTRRTIRTNSDRGGRPLVVWAFGGSTMFGWGVPDEETIASHLSAILSRDLPTRTVAVINHGHSYYFSSQELTLLQMLLRRGDHCDVAVFLDGLNDSTLYALQDVPAFTDRMRVAMEKEQDRNPAAQTYFSVSPDFPPLRLLRGVGRRFTQQPVSRPPEIPTHVLVSRYQFNLRAEAALGSRHGIKTLFFWQPVPGEPEYASARELAVRISQEVQAGDFHFLADIFQDMDPRDVWVDQHHYGDIANERVAEAIAREVLALVGN